MTFRFACGEQSGTENWSLNELVHAIVIMAHFHALTCFVYGCGVLPEPDFTLGELDIGKTAPPSRKLAHTRLLRRPLQLWL